MAFGYTALVLCATIVAVSSAGIIETLLSWDSPDSEARSTTSQSKCLCQTSGCLCCIDLNLTSTIELGGPACINIKQRDQNISLNMSYGDNIVQNATIKIADAANKPTCMNLLSDLAQICAKFTSVKQVEFGIDGCLILEPTLLGTTQATYRMGCFNFNQGVRQVEVSPITEPTSEDEDDGLDTDELIAAVSASAREGIALFSQWLDINLNPNQNTSGHSTKNHQHVPTSATFMRSGRSMIESQRDRSEENLRELLIAQDNIMKESAKVGHLNGIHTTFIYSKSVEQQKPLRSKKAPTVVVSRESRRGGRAYNIHQHVNEV